MKELKPRPIFVAQPSFFSDPSLVLRSFRVSKPLLKDISRYPLVFSVQCGYVHHTIVCFY